MEVLYAVSLGKSEVVKSGVRTDKSDVVCPDCVDDRWPEGVPEDDDNVTVVLHSDDWKLEVQGSCVECGSWVGS